MIDTEQLYKEAVAKVEQESKQENKQENKETFITTAYCPCEECSEGYGNLTATQTYAVEGRTVAVDTDVIPLGSIVEIDGNTYVAEDVGGGVKGNHIDIYMDCHEQTEEYGKQYKKVIVKKCGETVNTDL